jgi:hypothetical protein
MTETTDMIPFTNAAPPPEVCRLFAVYDTASGRVCGHSEGWTPPELPAGHAALEVPPKTEINPATMTVMDGVLVEQDPGLPDLAARREAAKAEAQAHRDCIVNDRCATPLGIVQCDEASRTNINGTVTMATLALSAGSPFEVIWRMADNSLVPHDAEATIAMGLAVGRFVADCYAASFAVVDQITESDRPESIDITAGYPA